MTTPRVSVFLVGGDKTEQKTIRLHFQSKNVPYDIKTAASTEDLQRQLGTRHADVILLNHHPEKDCAAEIHWAACERPVIFLIPSGTEQVLDEVAQNGTVDYLVKDPDGRYLEMLPLAIRHALRRRQHTTERLNAKKMEAITSLAGGIAHQFNNKLVGISGNLELMEIALPDNPVIEKYGTRIKSAVRQISYFTEQLLAYSRQGKYHPQKTTLNAFVRNVLPSIQSLRTKDIRLELIFSETDVIVNIDHAQMKLALSAIINNAVEAVAENGRIQVSTRSIRMTSPDNFGTPASMPELHACIAVQDSGKGMDPETVDRIFDPFFTTNFQGRGLEMAAAYGITGHHKGWISVDSTVGSGSTISIFLPAEPQPFGISAPQKPSIGKKAIGVVLLIDDEELVIDVGSEMLKKMGFEVIVAKTGEEALRIAETCNRHIDLVLLDIGGDTIYPRLTSIRPNIKVIVCSGYSLDGKAEEMIKAGANDFIQKPFAFSELSEKLKTVLAS